MEDQPLLQPPRPGPPLPQNPTQNAVVFSRIRVHPNGRGRGRPGGGPEGVFGRPRRRVGARNGAASGAGALLQPSHVREIVGRGGADLRVRLSGSDHDSVPRVGV